MEAIRRGYWPREVTKTPDVADQSQEAVIDEDVKFALDFLNDRPLNASRRRNRFEKRGLVLYFTGGNKVF